MGNFGDVYVWRAINKFGLKMKLKPIIANGTFVFWIFFQFNILDKNFIEFYYSILN